MIPGLFAPFVVLIVGSFLCDLIVLIVFDGNIIERDQYEVTEKIRSFY